VSWSLERQPQPSSQHTTLGRRSFVPTALQITTSPERTTRGRSLQRELSEQGEEIVPGGELGQGEEPAPRRTSSRASKRSAGLVFLSVWALFSVGSLNGSLPFGKRPSVTGAARDLSDRQLVNRNTPYPSSALEVVYDPTSGLVGEHDYDSSLIMLDAANIVSSLNAADDTHDDKASSERVLGRMFAWLCTTLYLTSRLPQIWKNVRMTESSVIFHIVFFWH
jgi:solute carrier family 66 (lysosomal lysine-arginine transporter), member 1